ALVTITTARSDINETSASWTRQKSCFRSSDATGEPSRGSHEKYTTRSCTAKRKFFLQPPCRDNTFMATTTENLTDLDAIVCGGGPAGSTFATIMARAGRRVALFERERFPRFHIGESLLPWNVPLLERIGVLHKVRSEGMQVK